MRKLVALCCALALMAPVCDGEKSVKKDMTIASKAFAQGETIPVIHTCDGQDHSPPLSFKDVPQKAVSLALVVDDPDAPSGTFIHWIAWNIDPKTKELPAEIKESDGSLVQGNNTRQKAGYMGPCPPPGKPHRYFFKLYALDTKLNLPKGATFAELEKALKGHILQETSLMGTFQRMPNH